MNKKWFALILAACVALVSWSAIAESVDLDAIAKSHIPEDAVLLSREMDDGAMEMKYWIAMTQDMYEVTLHPDTGAVLKVESDRWLNDGSLNVTLTETDILPLVEGLFPGAHVLGVQLRTDDGLSVYKVQIGTDLFTGQLEMHPETGDVLERDLDYTKPYTAPVATEKPAASQTTTAAAANPSADSGLIGKDKAEQIALERAGSGTVTYIKLDRDDGRQVYEGEIVSGQYEYEFEIDAETGRIRDWDKDRIGD